MGFPIVAALGAAGVAWPIIDMFLGRMSTGETNRAAGNAGLESLLTPRPLDLVQIPGQEVPANFMADILSRGDVAMSEAYGQANQLAAFRALIGPRASDLAAISIQSQPHPLELMASARGFLNA